MFSTYTIKYKPQNTKYKVGRCYWRKNSRLIYLYPGKYDWEGSPAHGDCSLRIKVSKNEKYIFSVVFFLNSKDDHQYPLSGNLCTVWLRHVAMYSVRHNLPGPDLLQGHTRLRPCGPRRAQDSQPCRDSAKGRCLWNYRGPCWQRSGGILLLLYCVW